MILDAFAWAAEQLGQRGDRRTALEDTYCGRVCSSLSRHTRNVNSEGRVVKRIRPALRRAVIKVILQHPSEPADIFVCHLKAERF